jgi:hypothetical protein
MVLWVLEVFTDGSSSRLYEFSGQIFLSVPTIYLQSKVSVQNILDSQW